MRIAYLGEMIQGTWIHDCLVEADVFERVDHFTKQTLNFTHIHMNPLPDALVLKCDFEDGELTWATRYSPEIPKIFVACEYCLRKALQYGKLGYMYRLNEAIEQKDLEFKSLVDLIIRSASCDGHEDGSDWEM